VEARANQQEGWEYRWVRWCERLRALQPMNDRKPGSGKGSTRSAT